MTTYHKIESIKFENGVLSVVVDGKMLEKPLSLISARLCTASDEDLKKYEISPSGYGIYWPLLDEDISIDGLLGIVHTPKNVKKSA